MNEIERQIYASTFAALFVNDWGGMRIGNGFSFAEIADEAVRAHRAALASEDAQYLLIVTEGKTP